MAKLPRTGVGYQFLYEYDCTLPGVMASLGLKRLSKKTERKIRDRFGFALAKREEPYAAVEVHDVVLAQPVRFGRRALALTGLVPVRLRWA